MATDMFERYDQHLSDHDECKMCIKHRYFNDDDDFLLERHLLKPHYYIKKGESKHFKIDISNYDTPSAIDIKLGGLTYSGTVVTDPCYKYIDFSLTSDQTLAMDETHLIQDALEFEVDMLVDSDTVIIKLPSVIVLETQCTGIIRTIAVLGDDTMCGELMVCGELLQ